MGGAAGWWRQGLQGTVGEQGEQVKEGVEQTVEGVCEGERDFPGERLFLKKMGAG